MRHRGRDRPFRTSFLETSGLQAGLTPTTAEVLGKWADRDVDSVLVVPVAFVADHFETNYVLDIRVREAAEAAGIYHYEVTAALNTHPLFIEALGEATIAQLELPVDVNQLRVRGDGRSQKYPLRPLDNLPRYSPQARGAHCPNCGRNAAARRWMRAEDAEASSMEYSDGSAEAEESTSKASGSD